ncbi:MAG: hypothetical protein J0H20_17885 [Rhizobiales bacterium]|nr:hypothetical protein [Hyphomicrobiales bacterium]
MFARNGAAGRLPRPRRGERHEGSGIPDLRDCNGGRVAFPAEAQQALDAAVEAFWKSAPLTFKNARFVEDAQGFGDYTAHSGNSFAPSANLQVYLEPQGFGWAEVADGYKIAFSSEIEIRNASGQILTKSATPALFEKVGRNKNREFQITVGFQLPALKAGDYVLVLNVTDTTTGRSAPLELPFTVSG